MQREQRHCFLQEKGWQILAAIAAKVLPGMNELEAQRMAAATLAECGVAQTWHPTALKFDFSTLAPGVGQKPNPHSVLQHIAILDLGIVLEDIEVDCGLTLGFTPQAKRLAALAKSLCAETIHAVQTAHTPLRPSDAFAWIEQRALALGVRQIAPAAGHRLGPYPTPKKATKIRVLDEAEVFEKGGWMVEVHITDGTFGAFHEDFFWVP